MNMKAQRIAFTGICDGFLSAMDIAPQLKRGANELKPDCPHLEMWLPASFREVSRHVFCVTTG